MNEPTIDVYDNNHKIIIIINLSMGEARGGQGAHVPRAIGLPPQLLPQAFPARDVYPTFSRSLLR